jgi:thymidylate synthase (FAD)
MDKFLRVDVISKSSNPQKQAYADMHQCYSSSMVAEEFFGEHYSEQIPCYISQDSSFWKDPMNPGNLIGEREAGKRVVKNCLKHGHWGVIESPSISFSVGYFPHSVMQQARTHRIGIHFGVQSGRYTSENILNLARIPEEVLNLESVEEVFYLRPVGFYTDRKGCKYTYTEEERNEDLKYCYRAALRYADKIYQGFSEEHARGLIPFDIRQHFTVSFNIRSLFHFLDMRSPKDAQLEIRWLCDLMWPHVKEWIPEIADHYEKTRWGKNKLAP